MKNIHKLAAIDIGSNAVRLLITSIRINKPDTKFKKISLVRVPLRLGEDVFSNGKISEKKLKKLQKRLSKKQHSRQKGDSTPQSNNYKK